MSDTLPQGWITATIDALNEYKSRLIDPQKYAEETFELYSVPIFPTGQPEIVQGQVVGSSKQLVELNDILVCKINPRINRVWRVSSGNPKLRKIASSEGDVSIVVETWRSWLWLRITIWFSDMISGCLSIASGGANIFNFAL